MPRRRKKDKRPLAERKADPTSNYWDDRAMTLWGEIVRTKGTCEKCGRVGRVEAHHLITRAVKSLCHKIENSIALCFHCHRVEPGSAHEDPVVFTQWLNNVKPDQYQWVMENKHKIRKPDFKQAYEDLVEIKRLSEQAAPNQGS